MMTLKKMGMLTTLTALLCGPDLAFADAGQSSAPTVLTTRGSSVALLNVRFVWHDNRWYFTPPRSSSENPVAYDHATRAWVTRVSATMFYVSCFADRPCGEHWSLVAALPNRTPELYDCWVSDRCTRTD